MSWETVILWSTLLNWCLSFVSLPNRARPWRRTSSAGGWGLGEKKIYHLFSVRPEAFEVAKMGHSHHPKPRTQSTCICTSCHRAVAVSKPLTGVFPGAGDLTWAGPYSCLMKQLGQKAEHWVGEEVLLLLPFSASISTDADDDDV